MPERNVVFEHVMEPGTGKAVPVLRGQILRIEQLGKGQCADFNAFKAESATPDELKARMLAKYPDAAMPGRLDQAVEAAFAAPQ